MTPDASDVEDDVEELVRSKPIPNRELMFRRLEGPMAAAAMQRLQACLKVLGAKHPETLKLMRSLSSVPFRQHHYDKLDNIKCLLLDLSRTVMKGDKNSVTIEAIDTFALA